MYSGTHPVVRTRRSRSGFARVATLCALAAFLAGCGNTGNSAPAAQTPPASPAGEAPAVDPDARLRELGIELPDVAPPVANYVKAVRVGNLLFLSGHGPCGELTPDQIGKVGADLTIEQGAAAARATGICMLATLKSELGQLSRVRRVVKVLGLVNGAPTFGDQPKVMNGFSDLMVEVFGDRGRHARTSVGAGSLPNNMAVEIEMIVEVE
ncbi:MAG TPA: RidA family protein [Vicinamibacterales bacterium]